MDLATSNQLGKLLPGILFTALFASSAAALAQTTPTDGEALRAELHQRYPSLTWVEQYRQAWPAEAHGDTALWRGGPAPALDSSARIVDALAALQDRHVALAGPEAGKQETLGVLFRTSSDAAMVVWRHLDPAVTALRAGDQVVDIDSQPVARWLEQAAAVPSAATAVHAWRRPRSSSAPPCRPTMPRSD
ncbi:hypothetical protein [Massilia sp. CCM 8734]|uniref:hypothetical protein n=1 Tax=Massilia sp. CCM 8734 TaxID=2609283 RepID=UPI0014243E66|nr:hypothetical protein [Massilia sp. CCM 8734]NHZ96107.1 hypothetical protein [Massilia sp. CCM 8734]